LFNAPLYLKKALFSCPENGVHHTLIATEQDMDVANLPDKIKNAIQTKYPDAALSKAERIERKGKTQYEIQILKGSRKEVLLDSNGKILKEE
jgi:hypothetical protein